MKTCFKKQIFKDYLKLICQDFIGKVENLAIQAYLKMV